jgi:hypothetical protein
LFRRTTERINVVKVDMPPGRELILNKMLSGDKVCRHSFFERTLHAVHPCHLKGNAIDLLEDINAVRFDADLKSGFAVVEDFWGYVGQGRSIFSERSIDRLAILLT